MQNQAIHPRAGENRHRAVDDIRSVIKSLGLVFGDIGTSPIYTLTVIFLLLKPTVDNVMGVLSLVVWTLIVLVSVEYAWLAMSLGEKGEGGTIILRGHLIRLLKRGRGAVFVTILAFIGISLLVGDGVITPAISILSAVEGILLIPGLHNTERTTLILIAGAIAIALFAFQRKGTGKVAGAFGPLMLLWFLVLAVSGVASIIRFPSVWKAINPRMPSPSCTRTVPRASSCSPRSSSARLGQRHSMRTWATSGENPSSRRGVSSFSPSYSTTSGRARSS